MLAAGVRVQGPVEAHALDPVQGRFALDLEVLDVGESWLRRVHLSMIEQTFVFVLTPWVGTALADS